jgi:predicted alpha/beta-hydrolase family hydrolase
MESLRLRFDDQHVSALLLQPETIKACFVFAHGAGAGMTHRSMNVVAENLANRGIATLRYQFPYMERGSKRTDPPAVCHATVRAAVEEASRRLPNIPLFAGGRSFGGRMTSQAQALDALRGIRGLIFLGFPLHPAGKPSSERATHLADVKVPMLFLQGTRDDLADLDLLRPVISSLADRAELHLLEAADHSFHVLARSGRNDAAVTDEACEAIEKFCAAHS